MKQNQNSSEILNNHRIVYAQYSIKSKLMYYGQTFTYSYNLYQLEKILNIIRMTDQWLANQKQKLQKMEDNITNSAYPSLKNTSLHSLKILTEELSNLKGELQYADEGIKEEISTWLEKLLLFTSQKSNLCKPQFIFGNQLRIQQDQFKDEIIEIHQLFNDLCLKDTTESIVFQQNIIEPIDQIVLKTHILVNQINKKDEVEDSFISSMIFAQLSSNKNIFKHQITMKYLQRKVPHLQFQNCDDQNVILDITIQNQPRLLTLKIINPKIHFGLLSNDQIDQKQAKIKNHYDLVEDSMVTLSENYNLIVDDIKLDRTDFENVNSQFIYPIVQITTKTQEQFQQIFVIQSSTKKFRFVEIYTELLIFQLRIDNNNKRSNERKSVIFNINKYILRISGSIEVLDDGLSHEIQIEFNNKKKKYEIQCTRRLQQSDFLPQIKGVRQISINSDDQNQAYFVNFDDQLQITLMFLEDWSKKEIEYA